LIILGIDPGSRFTGYGIIKATGQRRSLVTSGVIKLASFQSVGERLRHIYQSLDELIQIHRPNIAAMETVFMSKNPSSALKLGQARGVAMVVMAMHDLTIHEYSPREVKLAVTGSGGADKLQVDKMVRLLLLIDSEAELRSDETDALGIAMCCANNASVF